MVNQETKEKSTLSTYMDYVSLYKNSPKPIYTFDKNNNFEEVYFYQYIEETESVENSIFTSFFNNALASLSKSYRYNEFDSNNKLISFYYILFEILTTNRNYILYLHDQTKDTSNEFCYLEKFKINLLKYGYELGLRTLSIEHNSSRKNKKEQKGILEEFMLVFKFWLDDDSYNFEKTAVYIHEFTNKNRDLKTNFVSENLSSINKLRIIQK